MARFRVLKWTVPVDDRPHPIGSGKVVLVDCQDGPDAVQVWTLEHDITAAIGPCNAQVFGTGQVLPEGVVNTHLGSVATEAGLVWHLFEVLP